LVLCGSVAHAADVPATSCSRADVNTAIGNAVGGATDYTDGDRVVIPACTLTAWTTNIVVPNSKHIQIVGAGKNDTLIDCDITSGTCLDLGTSKSRITGIGFSMTSGTTFFRVRSQKTRVDNCKITNNTGSSKNAFDISGDQGAGIAHPTVVIDHNEITNARIVISGDLQLLANTIWAQATKMGNPDQTGVVYIEDNTITFTLAISFIDANYGGRYVLRKNVITGREAEAHSVQGNNRAARSWEVYDNSFTVSSALFCGINFRGGTGVIFGNKFFGPFTIAICFDNRRSTETFATSGACDGNSTWDGNTPSLFGWPCRDQIGRSTSTNETSAQDSEPAYIWDNTDDGVLTNPVVRNCTNQYKPNGSCDDIVLARDYFNSSRPGYTPYTYPHPWQGKPTAPLGVGVPK
jgi:hypothetical protein